MASYRTTRAFAVTDRTYPREALREAYRVVHLRCEERDDAEGKHLVGQVIDLEIRQEIGTLLGFGRGFDLPDWPVVMTRLREFFTTHRRKPVLP